MTTPGINRPLKWPATVRELTSLPFRMGIRFYQLGMRPFLPSVCRFEPSCSNYGTEALETHGLFRGTALTIWRVLRCNPLSKGGFDPVPSHSAGSPDRTPSGQASQSGRRQVP